ncbi:arsenate reductase (glutaredoxin) [Serratia symbiotica]|uniref:arsenate reductase (glutaredoxin) n=1 Tax=Serratia symbiotica TaxID=138074 RepID=UPI0030D20D23|nr:arsenate reductase (glutaredoxin) [Serratia symbiotica]
MKHVTVYNNPHYSKSRECLSLLKQRGVDANVVLYFETPPSGDELHNLLKALDFRSARDLMRKKEDLYQELKLADASLSEQEFLTAMTEHPKLIKRPIVVAGGKARIGRSAEQVLEIL